MFEVSRLESLLESAKLLTASLELEDLLKHLLRTVMGRLLVSRGLVALQEGGMWRIAICRGVPAFKKDQPFDPQQAHSAGLETVFPIGDPAQPLGILALGAPARGELDPDERDFLQALLGLSASSISNARAHRQVIASNHELRALLDLGRGLASTIEPEEVAQLLMLTLAGRWGVGKQAIFTWKDGQPPIRRAKGLDNIDPVAMRAALGESTGPVRVDNLLLLPIRTGESTIGVVVCGPRLGGLPYTESDLDFGAGLIAQAAVALENAWHFRDTLYRQQLEKELNLAAGIQQDLFPKCMPQLIQTEIAARNRQARQVGGDYYDVLPFGASGPDKEHLLCVADISGKGISASLLMANIQATLRALLSGEASLTWIAARANDLLHASTPSNKYATAIFVRYDPTIGKCEYVNGGHNDGVILRADGSVELLGTTGLPVGLFPKRQFESAPFELHPGDLLAIYSDGVPEACTADGAEFSLERFIDCLRARSAEKPEVIIDHALEQIDSFVAGAPQHDDITLMVLKRTAA